MTRNTKAKTALLSLLFFQIVFAAGAQLKYYAKDDLEIVVSGTSTMHDWDMKTSKGESNATITLNASGQLSGLTALNFKVPAETLKSDHKSMDKNAYKALKTAEHSTISYTLSSATITPGGVINCQGKLSIAGLTLDQSLAATGQVNADKSISVKGSKKISMKDYNMIPPTFMLGTVKTGDDVTVQFNLTLRK